MEENYYVTITRAIKDALHALKSDRFDWLFLDHDLGEGADNNGYYFLKLCFEEGIRIPPCIKIVSSNPVGKENMAGLLQSLFGYYRVRTDILKKF